MSNEITPEVGIACAAFCFLVRGCLLSWGVRMFLRNRRAERAGVRVNGTVVAHNVTIDSDNNQIYKPVIEFMSTHGQAVRIESAYGSSDFLRKPVGSHVLIHYDPQRPESADIVGASFLGVVVLCCLGAGFCLFGLLALVAGFLLHPR